MSSSDYVARSNADPEKSPLEKAVMMHSRHLGLPFPLRYEKYTDEQKFAVVLEQLVASGKQHLAMLQICLIAAQAFKESKHQALKNWCDNYLETYLQGDNHVVEQRQISDQ